MDIVLNTDASYVRELQKAIKKNNGHCPDCAQTPAHKCHRGKGCAEFQEQNNGWCAKRLYLKIQKKFF